MPCMCGDIMCPSCGPAQGYNPDLEIVMDFFLEKILADLPPCLDALWLAEDLVDRFGRTLSQDSIDCITQDAKEWASQEAVNGKTRNRALWTCPKDKSR